MGLLCGSRGKISIKNGKAEDMHIVLSRKKSHANQQDLYSLK
jgi:hypothetical protein